MIDLDEMAEALGVADVIVVGFEFWPQRLLIDLRRDEAGSPPLIGMVEPVSGVQERTLWLNERRPGVPPPEQFLFFVWPHSVAFLQGSSFPPAVAARAVEDLGLDVAGDLGRAFAELAELEREEILAIVRGGEGYETIWHAEEDAADE